MVFWILGAMFVGALISAQWQIKRRQASWREVAQALGGSCIEKTWTAQVLIPIQTWTVTLDTFSSNSKSDTPHNTIHTRLRLPFTGRQDFGFILMRRNAMSRMLIETIQSPIGRLATVGNRKAQHHLQLLNGPDVRLGDQRFDGAFVLKSEQEEQARQLFEQVKSRLGALGDFQLFLVPYPRVTVAMGTKTMVLHYQEKGVVTDVAHIREVCQALEQIVQELHRAGVASNQKPPVPTPLPLQFARE